MRVDSNIVFLSSGVSLNRCPVTLQLYSLLACTIAGFSYRVIVRRGGQSVQWYKGTP